MTNSNKEDYIDRFLDVLSKPLSRYILSILVGIYPRKDKEESR